MRALAVRQTRGLPRAAPRTAPARVVPQCSSSSRLTRLTSLQQSRKFNIHSNVSFFYHQDSLLPLSLNEFDINFQNPLGTGAFGTVYPGHHLPTNREVAIKTVSTVSTSEECVQDSNDLSYGIAQETQAFMHMLETGASHPHVVDLVGCFEGPAEEAVEMGLELPKQAVEEPLHYFVMERLAGCSVQDLIESPDGLEEHEAMRLLRAMCQGLEHLHDHGIVHRDIKPDNVLLSEVGEPKLVDFSHAGVVTEDENVQVPMFTKKLGTPGYIAPEVLSQKEPYNAKCDIFSVGCTLHAMLADGRLPRRHPRVGILSSLPDSTSPEARELVEACLAYSPEDRPDVSEILNEACVANVDHTHIRGPH